MAEQQITLREVREGDIIRTPLEWIQVLQVQLPRKGNITVCGRHRSGGCSSFTAPASEIVTKQVAGD